MNVTDKMIGEWQKRMQDKIDNMTVEELNQLEEDEHISEVLEENPEIMDWIEKLAYQNKAYRETLEFYGNKNNYMKYIGMQPITPTIEIDSGKKAREILEND